MKLSLLLVLGVAGTNFLNPGSNADDDDAASMGKIHKINSEKFDKLNKVATPQYENEEHLKKAAFSPTPKPTSFPTLKPTVFPTPSPTKCLDWYLSDWSNWTPCSASCGENGKSTSVRSVKKPDQASFPNIPLCPNPFLTGDIKLSRSKECNRSPCPIDCVVDPLDASAWKPLKHKRQFGGKWFTAMKNVQTIAMQPENGGKPCPSLKQRTHYKTWQQHCESMLSSCKTHSGQFGCLDFTDENGTPIGAKAWGKCQANGYKYRNRIEKKCLPNSAAGVVMHYKETAKCAELSV